MTTILTASKEEYNHKLAHLKSQQQACSKLLIECVTLIESNPDYTERLTVVMNQVETMMAQNKRLIARMESSITSKR